MVSEKRNRRLLLFDCVSEIYDSVENREKVNVILYDFKNAFGCLVLVQVEVSKYFYFVKSSTH
jgi:hypothetical protein